MCTVLHNALQTDIYIYIYIYIYTNIAESRIERDYWPRFARYAHAARQLYNICQDGGDVGFVDFTKLSFALSSLAQPFDQMGCIS